MKAYARPPPGPRRDAVRARGVAYAVDVVNAVRRRELAYRHSEADLNEWGYALLGQGEREAALGVFQVNVSLRPASANAHDSLAEGYEAAGDSAAGVRDHGPFHDVSRSARRRIAASHARRISALPGRMTRQ